jgi:signal transduction histidine kinase
VKQTVAYLRRGIAFGRSERTVRLAALAVIVANGALVSGAVSRSPLDATWVPIGVAIGILALAAFLRPIEPAPGEKFSVAAAVTYFAAVVMPPAFAVLSACAASLVAKASQRRSPLSTAVNTAQVGGATAGAAITLDVVARDGAVAVAAAGSVYFVVTLGSVALMILASQGLGAVPGFVRREALPTAALLGIGGVAGLAWTRDPLAIVLFIPALAAIELAVRRPAAHRSATAAAEGARGGSAVDAAHELRTPLATLASDLAYVRSSLPPAEAEALASARQQARRLSELVDRLLLLGRVEGGSPSDADSDVRHATERALAPIELQERVHLVIDVAAGLVARIPADLLEVAVRDLVSNALAYTAEGTVGISARSVDGKVRIRVSDTGIGISPAELPRIFERFYRGGRAARMAPGTGLGLAIVRRIVESCGGEVEVRSEVGRGTEVTLVLPPGGRRRTS